MKNFLEKIDALEEYFKNIVEDIFHLIVNILLLGSKFGLLKLITGITLFVIPGTKSIIIPMIYEHIGAFVSIFTMQIIESLVWICTYDGEDIKLSEILEEIGFEIHDLTVDILDPVFSLSKKIEESKTRKQQKIKLKVESKLTTKVEDTKEVIKDDILENIKKISTMTDQLSKEKKGEYKSELKAILSEYTSKLKELVIKYEDKDKNTDSLSLDSKESLTMKTIQKLAIIELKVQKDLIIEGKLKQIDEQEQQLLDIIDDKGPVLKI